MNAQPRRRRTRPAETTHVPAREQDEHATACVVTGAASGIGLAIAARMLERFHVVVAVDIDGDRLAAVGRRIAPAGRFLRVVGDVADAETHERAAAAAVGPGQLKGWVNNAGFNVVGAIHEIDEETASRGMAVNFGGVFLGTQMAVRAMLDGGGGAIVNVSSLQARFGVRGFPLYAAAKGAVVSLTRQVAAEYADRGIRCNAVAPGVIQTPMNERLLRQRGHGRRSLEALSPMRRLGRAEEVAAAVAFLLGDEATFITGEVLAVDGGQQVIPPNHFLRGEPD